jgi:uroporphyrinogen decarboxylase
MIQSMSPRERVLTTLRRGRPDCVPKDLDFTEPKYEEFVRRAGQGVSVADYFRLEPRGVGIASTRQKHDFSAYFTDVEHLDNVDEWGVGYISAHFYHFWRHVHPLRNAQSPREIAAYPWPDVLAPYRWAKVPEQVRAWQDQGYPVCAGPPSQLYEQAWYLRGQEQLLLDFFDNPDLAVGLLDTINHVLIEGSRLLAQAGVDVLRLGDDVGSQKGMIMSPDTWRQWLKPRLAFVISTAKRIKPDMLVFFHTDGNVEPIIPDLIEAGVDILNPVQPECMDPVKIKRQYGDRLSFWGTIGTQSTMPFGTAEEVRRVVKERIETVGPEGLLLAPTHVLEPEVPWENVVAFVDAVEEYGVL